MIEVHFKQLPNCVAAPQRMRGGDAASDLTSAESVTLNPGQRAPVRTGIAVAIPLGWCGLVLPRSGLALNQGITVLNAPGLIDSGYRGEIVVILHNTSDQIVQIDAGSRVAQLMIAQASPVEFSPVEELPEAPDDRGAAGFGSSGD